LGGNIEFTEHSKQALKREIYEELQAEVCQVELLDVIENIYYYKEKYSHELMFVYDGVFEDESFYEVNELNAFEKTDGRTFKVKWKSLEDFIIGDDILYPEGLLELLMNEFSIDYPSIFIESQESEVSIKY
jgi:8-oxo-dGTP pyrophosphatase MutT (NUDIX family)